MLHPRYEFFSFEDFVNERLRIAVQMKTYVEMIHFVPNKRSWVKSIEEKLQSLFRHSNPVGQKPQGGETAMKKERENMCPHFSVIYAMKWVTTTVKKSRQCKH